MRTVLLVSVVNLCLLGLWSPLAAQQAQRPELIVTAPTNEMVIQEANVTVEFNVNGVQLVQSSVPLAEAGKRPDANRPGEGHIHLMLDLQPVVVWERNEPYTFNNIPPGEHQLMVELVNNDHSPLSPPVVQNIRFQTVVTLPATGGEEWPLGSVRILLPLVALLLVMGTLLRRRTRSL